MNINIQRQINIFLANYFTYLVFILVIVILSIGYLFVLKPKKEAFEENIGREAVAREQQYLALKKDLAGLEELSLAYKGIDSKNIAKLDKILPLKPDLEELMKQIEVIVFQNGLLMTSMAIREELSKTQKIGVARITLSVVGTDYMGLKTLLRSFENNLRLLDVQTVNFTPDGRSANLEINAYYQL